MISDFTPVVHHLEGRTIKLWPVSDVHIGAAECDMDGFAAFLKTVEQDDCSYICILGDLLNNATRTSLSNVYQEVGGPSWQIEKAVELLTPVKDKILGVVSGNHEARSRREVDMNPLLTTMCILGKQALFRENMCFMRIVLGEGSTKSRYAVMITHGKSNAKKRSFQAIVEGVDAQIYGHTHTPDISLPSRIRMTSSNRVVVHNVVSMTACSWLKAGGYSLSGLYTPQAVSRPQCLVLEYTGTNSRQGNVSVQW